VQLSAFSHQLSALVREAETGMQNFRNLKVWEKAHALTLEIYKSSKTFPRDEMYGLTSQMRRASASIGANIAEGSCRRGDVDFARFLQMAAGSASELEYHLLLARDLDLLKIADYQRLSVEAVDVKRMLASLMQKLRADS
jgi:four helix bundle protein